MKTPPILKINEGFALIVFCVKKSVTRKMLLDYCRERGHKRAFITNRKFNEGLRNGCRCEQNSNRKHLRVDLFPEITKIVASK